MCVQIYTKICVNLWYNKQDMQERRVAMKKNKLPIWALVVMDLAAGAVCVGLVLLVLYVLPQGTTVSEQETQEATAQFALPSQGSGESAASAEGDLAFRRRVRTTGAMRTPFRWRRTKTRYRRFRRRKRREKR